MSDMRVLPVVVPDMRVLPVVVSDMRVLPVVGPASTFSLRQGWGAVRVRGAFSHVFFVCVSQSCSTTAALIKHVKETEKEPPQTPKEPGPKPLRSLAPNPKPSALQ